MTASSPSRLSTIAENGVSTSRQDLGAPMLMSFDLNDPSADSRRTGRRGPQSTKLEPQLTAPAARRLPEAACQPGSQRTPRHRCQATGITLRPIAPDRRFPAGSCRRIAAMRSVAPTSFCPCVLAQLTDHMLCRPSSDTRPRRAIGGHPPWMHGRVSPERSRRTSATQFPGVPSLTPIARAPSAIARSASSTIASPPRWSSGRDFAARLGSLGRCLGPTAARSIRSARC